MTVGRDHALVKQFAGVAERARRAGFDAAEINAGLQPPLRHLPVARVEQA